MLNNPIVIGGASLPTLTNPGTAGDLLSGKQLIDQNGNVITGTMTQFISRLNKNSNGIFSPGYFDTASQSPVTDLTLTSRGWFNLPFGSTWSADWKKARLVYAGPYHLQNFDAIDEWLASKDNGYSAVIGMTLLFYYDSEQDKIRPTLCILEKRTKAAANYFSLTGGSEFTFNYNITSGLYNSSLYVDIELTDGKTAFLYSDPSYTGPKGDYNTETYNVP